MADEIKGNDRNQNQEEGYQFPSKESKEFGHAPHSGGTESLSSLLKNKRLVGVVGGLFLLYIIMNLFSGSGDEITPVEDSAPEVQQQEAPQAQQSEVQQPAAQQASIFDTLDEQNQKPDPTDESMTRMKTQINSLNRQSSESRVKIRQLENKIDSMTKTLNDVSTQISKFVKVQEDQKKSKKKEPVLQEYSIRAIITGRAWVEDSTGSNMTVKIGDTIPTYGRVTKIKPIEGVVETSSGRKITFGSHD